MSKYQKVNFDDYSASYQEAIQKSIGVSGDSVEYFDQYKINCLKRWLLKERKEFNLLDYGCGIGKLSQVIAYDYPQAQVYGYDPSEQSLDYARKKSNNISNLYYGHELHLAAQYDYAISSNVFHHIHPNERDLALNEIHRSLKKGGVLVIIEHNPLNPLTRIVVKRCEFDWDAILLKPNEIKKRANETGFIIKKKRYIVFFPRHLSVFRCFEPWMSPIPIGAQFYIELIKN